MSKQYICPNCHRGLSNRPSLSRHKKYHCSEANMGHLNKLITPKPDAKKGVTGIPTMKRQSDSSQSDSDQESGSELEKYGSDLDTHEDETDSVSNVGVNRVSQDKRAPVKDILTFNGAEFSGKTPKSRETLLKLMKVMDIPPENRPALCDWYQEKHI